MKCFSSAIIILLIFSCFFFYACPKAIEPPKPRATITVDVGPWPLDVDMNWWNYGFNYIYISFNVIISEGSGVGGNVSTVTSNLYKGNTFEAGETKTGGRFGAFGSLTVSFTIQVWGPDYKVDKLTVEVKGGDDNDYSFTENYESPLSWGMNTPEILIR